MKIDKSVIRWLLVQLIEFVGATALLALLLNGIVFLTTGDTVPVSVAAVVVIIWYVWEALNDR